MTRINCVPPLELTNKHLVAEYRELPRIFALACHREDAPKEYCLGKGHMLFFYDKLKYLANRQLVIVAEMLKRGMNPSYDPLSLWAFHVDRGGTLNKSLWNDWEPDEKALAINRECITDRLNGIKYSKT